MLRNRRTEKNFFKATAIHGLDTLRSIAGNINDYSVDAQQVADVSWYHIRIAFENGVTGLLDVMPSCGSTAESYEMYGADCRVVAYVNGESAGKIEAWENGKIVHCSEPAQEMPSFVQDGTFAETFEFINALQENRSPYPSPSQVWQSVELCDRIQCGSGAWR